jgi:hypothetical protein
MANQKFLHTEDGEIAETVPEIVQSAADAYVKFLRQLNTVRGKKNEALDALILRMKEEGITRMLIDEGAKILELDEKDIIKIKKRKEPAND